MPERLGSEVPGEEVWLKPHGEREGGRHEWADRANSLCQLGRKPVIVEVWVKCRVVRCACIETRMKGTL